MVVFVLGVIHTLGAGTDATSPWLLWPLAFISAGIAVLFAIRVGSSILKKRAGARARRPAPELERPEPRRAPAPRRRPAIATTRAVGEEAG